MASNKRKEPPKGHKVAKDSSSKRTKVGKVDDQSSKPSIVKLRDDEPMFKRGGGDVLTPLERRNIQLEADADAKAEYELEEESKAKTKAKAKVKVKTRTKRNGHDKTDDAAANAEPSVRIEGLSIPTLTVGTLVLGQIAEIHLSELHVALPNDLVGHVSITSISNGLTARLQQRQDAMDTNEDEDTGSDNEDPNIELKSLFEVGQYVRACVLSTTTEATEEGSNTPKRRIELSLRPEDTNADMSRNDIVTSVAIMAAIASVEDHGCVMDVGLSGIKGFLNKDKMDPAMSQGRLQPGNVLLCLVVGRGPNKTVLHLTTEPSWFGNPKARPHDATSIKPLQPGTLVEMLVSEIMPNGLLGKVLGLLDAVADRIHSGLASDSASLEERFKLGQKLTARVICNFPNADDPKIGVSLLPHIVGMTSASMAKEGAVKSPREAILPSSAVEKCIVRVVVPKVGLYVDLGPDGPRGFVHISRLQDGRDEVTLLESSGPFRLESAHKGRVLRYNPMDNLFALSFEKSVLEMQYLRFQDMPVGAVVQVTITSHVVDEKGLNGLVVKVNERIKGLVPAMHFSDVDLKRPEVMFPTGKKVKARVLWVDEENQKLRLTLKKTLVNSDVPIVKEMTEELVGTQALGTVIKLGPSFAILQFYGSVRGFLHKAEISESFVSDASDHLRLGQVVSVFVKDVDLGRQQLVLTCKDPKSFTPKMQKAYDGLQIGEQISGKVVELGQMEIVVTIGDSGLKAMVPVGHLADSQTKVRSRQRAIGVGMTMKGLMVLRKEQRLVTLTMKKSLMGAFKAGNLLTDYLDAKSGQIRAGYVSRIDLVGIQVRFGGHVSGFIPKAHLPPDQRIMPQFGTRKHASINVVVLAVELKKLGIETDKAYRIVLTVPGSEGELYVGSIVTATVTKVRDTQLNVRVGEMQGRVDVSEVFDRYEDIENPKAPLSKYKKDDLIKVRVMGLRHINTREFLPISHRSTREVIELTAKPSALEADTYQFLTMDKLTPGMEALAFVNQSTEDYVWAHLSPQLKSRIRASEMSSDPAVVEQIRTKFPVGCAIKPRVKTVDLERERVGMTLLTDEVFSWLGTRPNDMLTATVTKVLSSQVVVQIRGEGFPIRLVDLADDFDEANPHLHKKFDIIKVSVVDVDPPNKRLRLSTRPSRILSSKSPVVDREIISVKHVSKGDIVRGFVRNVADSGLFVDLGGPVVSRVQITNLSDKYLKEWKEHFQVQQLVKARVLFADPDTGKIELSLKESVLADEWRPKLTLEDVKMNQLHTGTVRKVETFGAFVEIDNSANVRGLCHRTQMSDGEPVMDATKLYKEGDRVKVFVLRVDLQARKLNLSLKASHFDQDSGDESDNVSDADDGGAPLDLARMDIGADETDGEDEWEGVSDGEGQAENDKDGAVASSNENGDVDMTDGKVTNGQKYDWNGDAFTSADDTAHHEDDDDADDAPSEKKKTTRRKKAEIEVDRTAELDVHGPQSASDFERLLLSEPDSSSLWVGYMAHQVQSGDVDQARAVAERGITTIGIREEAERLNVWIAYLNLEMAYGTKDKFDEVFKRACQFNDEEAVYGAQISNYIKASKKDDADTLFQKLVKRHGSKSPDAWLNYAHFLFVTTADPTRSRALLPRALRSLDKKQHAYVEARFAALEWKAPHGDAEKGRTLFEGLLARNPRKDDLWRQLLDAEKAGSAAAGGASDPEAVRAVFERRRKARGTRHRQARKWFDVWAEWEKSVGGDHAGVLMKKQAWETEYAARKNEAEELAEGGGDD